MVAEEKKTEFWNHFMSNEQFWGHGMTQKRLEKIKLMIWVDEFFWFDIVLRHGGDTRVPEEMKMENKQNYDHCFGNMAGMLMQSLLKNKIIK